MSIKALGRRDRRRSSIPQFGRSPEVGADGRVVSEEHTTMERHLEDFAVGQRFMTGRRIVEEAQIKTFAAEFDPQPFHLDREAAARSIFKGLVASGWHTAVLTMKLLVAGDLKPAGGIVGVGFEEFRWAKPVRPGDELRVESEVLAVRPSTTRPSEGLLKVRNITLNQRDEPVLVQVVNLLVPRRPTRNS
jgi:acyl dehydratase